MNKNVGNMDRNIRYGLAVVFAILGITVASWFWILAVISAATGFLGVCGIYKLLGINTCKMK